MFTITTGSFKKIFIVVIFTLIWIFCIVALSLPYAKKNKNLKNMFGVEVGYFNENDKDELEENTTCKKDNNFTIDMNNYRNLIIIILVIFLICSIFSFFIVFTPFGYVFSELTTIFPIDKFVLGIVLIVLTFVLLLQTSQNVMYSTLFLFIILIGLVYIYIPIEIRQLLIVILSFGLVIMAIIIGKIRLNSEKSKESFIAPSIGPCTQTSGKFGQLYNDKGNLVCVGNDGTTESHKLIDKEIKRKHIENDLMNKMKDGNFTLKDRKEVKIESKKNEESIEKDPKKIKKGDHKVFESRSQNDGNPFGFGVCLIDSGMFGVLMPYFGNKCVPFDVAMKYIKGLDDSEKKKMGLIDEQELNKKRKIDKKKFQQSSDCHPKGFNFEQECIQKNHNPNVGLKELSNKDCMPGFFKGVCELDYHNGVKLPKGNVTKCYPDGSNFNGICKKIFGSKPDNKSTNWGYEYILRGSDGGCPSNYSRVVCSELYSSGKDVLGNVSNCVNNWDDNEFACQDTAFKNCMSNVDQFEKELSDVEMNAYCNKISKELTSVGETYNSCIPPFKRAICKNKNEIKPN